MFVIFILNCHTLTYGASVLFYRWFYVPLPEKKKKKKHDHSLEPLDEGEKGEWKSWIKTQHSKN